MDLPQFGISHPGCTGKQVNMRVGETRGERPPDPINQAGMPAAPCFHTVIIPNIHNAAAFDCNRLCPGKRLIAGEDVRVVDDNVCCW